LDPKLNYNLILKVTGGTMSPKGDLVMLTLDKNIPNTVGRPDMPTEQILRSLVGTCNRAVAVGFSNGGKVCVRGVAMDGAPTTSNMDNSTACPMGGSVVYADGFTMIGIYPRSRVAGSCATANYISIFANKDFISPFKAM